MFLLVMSCTGVHDLLHWMFPERTYQQLVDAFMRRCTALRWAATAQDPALCEPEIVAALRPVPEPPAPPQTQPNDRAVLYFDR